jgi:predicted nucleic acid-binding protein
MNLLATGQCGAIIREVRLLIAPAVLAEAIYIYADDSRTVTVPVDDALLQREKVSYLAVELGNEETTLAVRYAQQLDDGEAQSLAVALHRNIKVLTDDVAGARVAGLLGLGVVTTLELIRAWAEADSRADVAAALRSMRVRANYAVPRSHPLADWYASQLQ